MLDLIRLAVELLGWLVVLWGTGLILWATSYELRRRVVRHMVEHAQGVCDGAAAAGMVPCVRFKVLNRREIAHGRDVHDPSPLFRKQVDQDFLRV